jgi:hypothetical protein
MARPKKGEPNKSAFIREHPELSPNELVARAKEAGLEIAPTLVYKVRGRAPAASGGGRVATPIPRTSGHALVIRRAAAGGDAADEVHEEAPAESPPDDTSPGPQRFAPSKAEFIRSLPARMPAKQVVAQGRAAGLELSEAYVYVVRSSKGAGRPRRDASERHVPVAASAAAPTPTGEAAEVAFRKLVVALGVERARALLDDVERKIEALIAG